MQCNPHFMQHSAVLWRLYCAAFNTAQQSAVMPTDLLVGAGLQCFCGVVRTPLLQQIPELRNSTDRTTAKPPDILPRWVKTASSPCLSQEPLIKTMPFSGFNGTDSSASAPDITPQIHPPPSTSPAQHTTLLPAVHVARATPRAPTPGLPPAAGSLATKESFKGCLESSRCSEPTTGAPEPCRARLSVAKGGVLA